MSARRTRFDPADASRSSRRVYPGREGGADGSWSRPARQRREARFTPGRVVLGAALVGSFLVAVYGAFLDRTAAQVPILASGLAVFGFACAVVAVRGGAGAVSAGRSGDSETAFRSALFGGIAAVAAAGSLGAAVILMLLWGTVPRVT